MPRLRSGISAFPIVAAAATAALTLAMTTPADAEGCGGEYTVASGDTLWRVAARCDTTVDALMKANPQITSQSRLSIGFKLNVPGADAAEDFAAVPEKGDQVLLEGWITNGQRCAMIATPDGQKYGVVSPELSFVSGRAVAVEGHLIDDPTCSGPRTLLVTALSTTEL